MTKKKSKQVEFQKSFAEKISSETLTRKRKATPSNSGAVHQNKTNVKEAELRNTKIKHRIPEHLQETNLSSISRMF